MSSSLLLIQFSFVQANAFLVSWMCIKLVGCPCNMEFLSEFLFQWRILGYRSSKYSIRYAIDFRLLLDVVLLVVECWFTYLTVSLYYLGLPSLGFVYLTLLLWLYQFMGNIKLVYFLPMCSKCLWWLSLFIDLFFVHRGDTDSDLYALKLGILMKG